MSGPIKTLLVGCLLWPVSAQAQDIFAFQTPSENIRCAISLWGEPSARCDLQSLTQSFRSPPKDCEFDWGASFALSASGTSGQLACVSDVVADGPFVTLDYGSSLSFGGITCVSEQTGLTCRNSAGHGFRLSRGRQDLF